MDVVRSCASSSSCPPHLRSHMQTMAGLDNIPRKEKQFRNLASNSLGLRGSNGGRIVDEIWRCLKQERERRLAVKEAQNEGGQKQQKQQQQRGTQEEETTTVAATQNEGKPTSSPAKDADHSSLAMGIDSKPSGSTSTSSKADAKRVKSAAKKALKGAPNRTMKTKELRKLLGKELPVLSKERLKELLAETTQSSKGRLKVDGKLISLN
jgi:hypothetical protein